MYLVESNNHKDTSYSWLSTYEQGDSGGAQLHKRCISVGIFYCRDAPRRPEHHLLIEFRTIERAGGQLARQPTLDITS